MSARPALTTDPAHYRWLIQHGPDDWRSHSFAPPATLAQLRGRYPGALQIDPEPTPETKARFLRNARTEQEGAAP